MAIFMLQKTPWPPKKGKILTSARKMRGPSSSKVCKTIYFWKGIEILYPKKSFLLCYLASPEQKPSFYGGYIEKLI